MITGHSGKRPASQVVVISGASSGIGRATAEAFARTGAKLVLASRDADTLDKVADVCRGYGAEVMTQRADVTEFAQLRDLAVSALAFGGRIDTWVSNSGVGAVGAFHEVPSEVHERVVKTNLIGHMNDALAVLPVFLQQERGVFVNVISLGGFAATPYAAAYSASKFGLRGFSEALRGELTPHPGIHICDIYPSFVDTPGISHGANYVGRRLSAPPPLLDPRQVAARIVRLSRRPRATTMVGMPTVLVRLAHAVSPQMTSHAMGAFLRAYFRRADRVTRTRGNLFAPPADPGGIDGGLRSGPQSPTALVAGALVAGGALALLASGRGRSRHG